ncbi:MAG: M48 family metallopeptidase [Candidatus Bathyarchaeota archaeon]|nr:M48 family metallopeptidase [Candidatus Bathyarchaeota archaeon]
MPSVSFHDEMARNKRSSLLLVVFIAVILFTLVYVFVYIFAPEYILFSIPISLSLIILHAYSSYIHGDSIVLSATNARPAEGGEYLYLRDTVEGLSIASGIPPPKVYIVENAEMNAFATGRDPEHASIAVTTGLVKETDRLELEGVVAHELSHVRNRDTLFMTLVAVLVGLVAIVSHVMLRAFRYRGTHRRRDKREGGIVVVVLLVGFLLAIFAPIVVRLVQFAVSRRREYLADSSAVELTRYPDGLASALEKIKQKNRGNMNVSEAVSHLYFVDPKHSPLDELYATHPPIEERIKRLRAM